MSDLTIFLIGMAVGAVLGLGFTLLLGYAFQLGRIEGSKKDKPR